VGAGHYENFPVASVLCAPKLRPAVLAIYRYARTADDIADEGSQASQARTLDLLAYREDLDAIFTGRPASARWSGVFQPLQLAVQTHRLPRRPLADLLTAFLQDVENPCYPTRAALLDYCSCSANPVGRLLLHLYGIDDPVSLQQSDHICTALQLINFWQDLSVDLPRGRVYVPAEDASQHRVPLEEPHRLRDDASTRRLVRTLCKWAEAEMRLGAPLALALPGRAGWELRFVVQGGLRVLHRIEALGFATVSTRPALGVADLLPMTWHAMLMGRRFGRARP
jgi:squalene synthase HpnC